MSSLTTHHLYPPFPANVLTAPLQSISLEKLQSISSPNEASKLFESSRTSGFFYLDLVGSELGENVLGESEQLHALQQEFYALPHEAKDEYGQDKIDPFFAYRWTQCMDDTQDVWGRKGRREMYNVSSPTICTCGLDAHLNVCSAASSRRFHRSPASSAATWSDLISRVCLVVIRPTLSASHSHHP